MYSEILDAVRKLALKYAAPYTKIEQGSLPSNNGLALYLGPGAPLERYLDRGGMYDVSVVLNGKHDNLQTLLTALSNIHMELSALTAYPRTERWQITDISTAAAPNYIDREQSHGPTGGYQWLYGSILKVTFYVQGGN